MVFVFTSLLFANGSRVKYSPEKPTINDIISITYNTSHKEAVIKNPSQMVLQIVFWKKFEDYIFKQIPMIKDGNYFTANVTLPNDSVVYITYKFVSESAIDDNNLQWWDIFLYDNTGKELEGGHYQKALSSLFSYDLKRKMDVSEARKELEKEIELYPDNIFALQTKWLNDIKVSNEDTNVVKDVQEKLRSAYEKWKTDEEATHYIAYAADYAKMTGLLNVIRDYYSIKSPKGKVIRLIRYFEALREKDPDKKIPLLKKYLEDFDNADPQTKDIIIGNIYDALNQKQDRDGLRKFFKEYKFDDIYYYINIGEIEFSNGNNIKEFSEFIDAPIDRLKNAKVTDKPPYMTEITYLRDVDTKLGILSAMKGRALFELKDTINALPYLDTYYKNMSGERGDYNSLYVECLFKNKRYEDVINVSSEIIKMNRYVKGIEKYYEDAWVIVKGSKIGFDEKLKEDLKGRYETIKREMIRKKINKPAPPFSLKDAKGNVVKLSDLKGKIVIIDFWAIWCGPCRSSFPSFQKSYEKYKDNKNIQFYAINTWEKVKEDEREKSVISFINSNNYTFPVLFDDTTRYVEKLGVESIPTKFAIDKEGKVQFVSVGFNGDDELIEEIDLWIDILLNEKK